MLKEITLYQAIDACMKERAVYRLVPVTPEDAIRDLRDCRFMTEEAAEKPQKTQKERKNGVDHGKIVALYRAKWTPKKIADELGCSVQTVMNHIKQEAGDDQ